MLAHMSLRRSLDWLLPAILAGLCTMALGTGFALALTGSFGAALAPLPPRPMAKVEGGAYRIVALGDSISEGTGDPVGGGYVTRLAEALRRRGLVVILTNLATGGAETGDVLQAARSPEAQRQILEADLLLVSAGGNDLSHSLRRVAGAEQGARPEADNDSERGDEQALSQARHNLDQLLRSLRAQNRDAVIRLLGIYNPFEITVEDAPRARSQLAEWNAAIESATHAHAGVVAVPVADLFYARPDRLAGDRYHPGPRGHEVIADRVLATLVEGDRAPSARPGAPIQVSDRPALSPPSPRR
jgi:lysophospholipase L1-like esterase